MKIPARFAEINTWKGKMDQGFLLALQEEYARQIVALANQEG